jgi:hypothetical protein
MKFVCLFAGTRSKKKPLELLRTDEQIARALETLPNLSDDEEEDLLSPTGGTIADMTSNLVRELPAGK